MRPPGRVERRARADVAPVAPLSLAVDAHDRGVHDRRRDADRHGQVPKCRLPEPAVLAVRAEQVGEVVEGIGRAFQRLRLGDRHVAVAPGGEGDPCREGMAFGRHEGERLGVGVDDHDAGRQLHRGAGQGRDLEQGDLARRDPGQRGVEPLAFRPVLREMLFPGRDDGFRCDLDAFDADGERLLPQLAEALERAGDALAGDGVVLHAGHAGGRQAVDRSCPVRGVAVGGRGVRAGGCWFLGLDHRGSPWSSDPGRVRRWPPRRLPSRRP